MRWGVRKEPQRSFRGNLHRGLSKVYGLNEQTYRKTGNKTLASMNAQAKNDQLRKAERADLEAKKAWKNKQKRAEKRKTNISKMRNYTGSNKSDALKSARRKDINKMSNADLQKTVNRLNLEKQYRDLTKVNLTPGKRYVDSYKDYNKSISQARKAASTVAVKRAMTVAAV